VEYVSVNDDVTGSNSRVASIGLALAKTFVELHGGKVEAKSEGLGQGSEFLVRLPVAAEPFRPHSL